MMHAVSFRVISGTFRYHNLHIVGITKCNNFAHLHVCWERIVTVFVTESNLAEYLRFNANVA